MKGIDKKLQKPIMEIVEHCIKKKDYEQLSRIGVVLVGFALSYPLALSVTKNPPYSVKIGDSMQSRKQE